MARYLRNFNYLMFLAMVSLVAIGTVAIWSAGNARAETVFHGMWKQTLVTAVFGLAVYLALSAVDYRKVLDYAAPFAYGVALLMLVAVLVFGSKIYGGRRWLWFFQPSEVSKLCIIMFLASLARPLRQLGFAGFLLTGAIVGIPEEHGWLEAVRRPESPPETEVLGGGKQPLQRNRRDAERPAE